MKTFTLLLLPFLSLVLTGCESGGDNETNTELNYRIELHFERIETGTPNPFRVTASLYKNNQLLTGTGTEISVTLGRGSRNAISETSTGKYQFTVTPVQTGEHSITVNYKTASITRTALVLTNVHADWGQPMAVRKSVV